MRVGGFHLLDQRCYVADQLKLRLIQDKVCEFVIRG